MNKAALITEIEGKYNAAQGCVMFAYLLNVIPWKDTVKNFVGPAVLEIQSAKNLHRISFLPGEILKRYENSKAIQDDGLDIIRLGIMDGIRRSFEATREYCESTSQLHKFKGFAWYHLARLIRNSFSHNFHLDLELPLTKKEKKSGISHKFLPPQTLKFSDATITIDQSLHGKELDFDILPIKYAIELIQIIKSSVVSDLT